MVKKCAAKKISKKSINTFNKSILHHVKYTLGKQPEQSTPHDIFFAAASACHDQMIDRLLETEEYYSSKGAKRLYYLSMEFLIGRSLHNNLSNLGLYEVCKEAVASLGQNMDDLLEHEHDPALGNGGLGRLAACFLDSLASLDMPGYGYGILYEYGLFQQTFTNGYQREKPDHWMAHNSPWLVPRLDQSCIVPIYGHVEHGLDFDGGYNPMWLDWQVLIGVPYDFPIVGYGGKTVNYLRLFAAYSSNDFDMDIFNEGDYIRAVQQKIQSETVSKVLYPTDEKLEGKELRLIQEYFLVACSIRDIVRQHKKRYDTMDNFADKVALQLNDTHPALTVAELMRVLVDEEGYDWDHAWQTTRQVCAYTNHTLLPEALERWPVALVERVLPRHMQIIYEINHQFLQEVKEKWPGDASKTAVLSIIEEGAERQVRMANLAIIGSHSVNGVAAVHSELVKTSLVPDFYALWPEKFNNKTNGITQRRWLLQSNPGLAGLINETIGDAWITDLDRLRELEKFAGDPAFQQRFMEIKRANKERLGRLIYDTTRITVSPDSMFDVQAKRMHEYKRQLLNVLHIINDYQALIEDGQEPPVAKTYVFAGKAAPGYYLAKLIIKLINNMGMVINNDPRVKDLIKVVLQPDYKVSVAEKLIPAAELSEQISTAGYEASGTGNMKFALNGALTIGTLDGANIEIAEDVGADNIYIFGLTVDEVHALYAAGHRPWDLYNNNSTIHRILDGLNGDLFCPTEPGLFKPLFDRLLKGGDHFLLLADLESYLVAQNQASIDYQQSPADWACRAILNVARMGKFSSDRTIKQYAEEIWGIERH